MKFLNEVKFIKEFTEEENVKILKEFFELNKKKVENKKEYKDVLVKKLTSNNKYLYVNGGVR